MNGKTIGTGFLVIAGLLLLVGSCRNGMATPAATATPTVTATMMATMTPAPLPAPTGTPQRVNFKRGSYGATLTGSGAQRFVLWAAAGQVFKAAMVGDGQSSLYSTDGKLLWADVQAGRVVTATLEGNGDQLLEIRSRGQFTVGVEIR